MRGKQLLAGAVAIIAIGAGSVPVAADSHKGESGKGHTTTVKLRDNCDPATFDAAFGPGTCAPHGPLPTVPLGDFLAKLNPVDFGHPQWRNDPARVEIESEDTLKIVVRGGEFHTFTEVAKFGAGCIAPLNDALGLTTDVPTAAQCGAFFATTGVTPGATLKVNHLTPGIHRFMCEIHPWMRTIVEVEGNEHEGED